MQAERDRAEQLQHDLATLTAEWDRLAADLAAAVMTAEAERARHTAELLTEREQAAELRRQVQSAQDLAAAATVESEQLR
ncbi:MAG: hypothetical protein JWL64_1779, partial [Frankiales bacterium]|nr:hypothetical protein [Frankiales bacterium]